MIKKELNEYKILLRNIPSLIVTVFVISVICMNILANKELLNTKYLALDCGYLLSWISFLCMDVICKRFGPKASTKISILAVFINLCMCGIFKIASLTNGMWGEYYSTNLVEVNTALNNTFGGTWYILLGSSIAMIVSSIVNSLLNFSVGNKLKKDNFKSFALRSYLSTAAGQFVDNLVFSTIVSKVFFGWSWLQVLTCSLSAAIFELLCEIIFSPIGYRICKDWEKDNIGTEYLNLIK